MFTYIESKWLIYSGPWLHRILIITGFHTVLELRAFLCISPENGLSCAPFTSVLTGLYLFLFPIPCSDWLIFLFSLLWSFHTPALLSSIFKMELVGSSKALVSTYNTTKWWHNPEGPYVNIIFGFNDNWRYINSDLNFSNLFTMLSYQLITYLTLHSIRNIPSLWTEYRRMIILYFMITYMVKTPNTFKR